MRRSFVALGAALALAVAPRRSRAQPAAGGAAAAPGCGVVVLAAETDGPFVERVRAELVVVGYAVERAAEFEPGRELGACVRAVVRVEAGRRRVELWTAAGRRRAQFRATVAADAADVPDDETLAVRVAEGVRGYLDPAGAAKGVATKAAAPAPLAPEARRVAAGVGLGAGAQPGGASAAAFVAVHGRWMASPRVGLGLLAALPVVASRVSRDGVGATLRPSLAGVEAYARLTRPSSGLDAGVGAGALLAVVAMNGSAKPPYEARADGVVTALPFASVEASARVVERVRWRAGFVAGAAVPQAGVRFAGRRVAEWGGPLLWPSAGVEIEF